VVNTRDRGGKIVPDTSAGSPLYQTPIFEEEESGDQELIESVITANLDPNLSEYANLILQLPMVTISLPPLLKEAINQDLNLQNEVFSKGETSSNQEIQTPLTEYLYRDFLRW